VAGAEELIARLVTLATSWAPPERGPSS